MPARWFRATAIACALSWFLVGLHVPALHAASHDGHAPSTIMLAVVLLLGLAGLASLWALLRASVAPRPTPGSAT